MLTKEHIDYRKDDREIWETELESWVPQRVYDCHMHLLDNGLIAEDSKYRDMYPDTDFETAKAWHNLVMPGRETHFLMLGRPAPGTDVYGHNTFMHREMQSDPLSRRNRLTMPSDTPEEIERDVKERGFVGLKVYRFYSVTGDIKDCRIHEFLPHEQLEVASDLGLWVTMHLSRAGGGDEQNLRDLEEYTTKRYPGIRWILAHCARSFVYWQMERGIDRLKAMPNIWYDTSAVTDVRPFITLFSEEDHRRIFYGTDGIESVSFHGAYTAFGRTHQLLETDKVPYLHFEHSDYRPVICLYEQLLAMKQAAAIAELSRDQIEDIFWRNAVRELGVDWPEG